MFAWVPKKCTTTPALKYYIGTKRAGIHRSGAIYATTHSNGSDYGCPGDCRECACQNDGRNRHRPRRARGTQAGDGYDKEREDILIPREDSSRPSGDERPTADLFPG